MGQTTWRSNVWWLVGHIRCVIMVMDKYEATNAHVTSFRLVLVLAETTEEDDVCVLGRRRAGCRWSLKIQMKWSDGMQEEWLNHPQAACYQMSDSVQRRWKRQCGMEKKGDQHRVTLWFFFKKSLMVEGPLKMTRWQDTYRQFPSNDRQERACWKQEKAPQVQKKNYLLAVASIHFHSKAQ